MPGLVTMLALTATSCNSPTPQESQAMPRKLKTRAQRAVVAYTMVIPVVTYQRAQRIARSLAISPRACLHAALARGITALERA